MGIFTRGFIIVLLLGFIACNSGTNTIENKQPAIPVVTAVVTADSVPAELDVSGNIEGRKTVSIGFLVAGKINYMAAEEGQFVKQNQMVASLDAASYQIAADIADVQVRQAQDEYNRLKLMYERNSISESDFKKIGFVLEQAQNQLKLQTKNVSDTKLYAPISGIVLKKKSETGQITGVGNPVMDICDISTVKANAYIPESELHNIQIGETASVYVSAVDKTFSGRVTEVGSSADPSSRTFTVKIELANPQLLIRPGMIAEVKFISSSISKIITVPAECLLKDIDAQTYVYIADVKLNKAFKRKVSIGRLLSNKIEITSGINEGELLITGGQQKLTDGSTITIAK